MNRTNLAALFVLLVLVSGASAYKRRQDSQGCTALAIAPKATADGSTYVSHGNDCATCDFRLVQVPAADHQPGEAVPIYMAFNDYPRLVAHGQGEMYEPKHLEKRSNLSLSVFDITKPMGYVPQVAHTYAYMDGAYGVMNEHSLGIGESTCDARTAQFGVPVSRGGNALFDIAALSRMALTRCKTARCAIRTMGDLATQYGFYGGETPDWSPGPASDDEGGEALTIHDPEEAWVFHICPDDTGKSAVWVAQRVPDDHISVVVNVFTIFEINVEDTENFMASDNIFEVAIRQNYWDPDGNVPFNFAKVYRTVKGHQRRGDSFIDHRRWAVFNKVAPSLGLSLYAHPDSFGFSIKPDHPLTTREVFAIHRDVFQGSPVDMGHDVIAGPFGDPARANLPPVHPLNDTKDYLGNFERSVSQTWTSYTTITQARAWLPRSVSGRVWYGAHDAMTTLFVPVYASSEESPKPLAVGSLMGNNKDSLWWAVCVAANYMARYFSVIYPEFIKAQESLETQMIANADEADKAAVRALDLGNTQHAQHIVTSFTEHTNEQALDQWLKFYDFLISKYHDASIFLAGETAAVDTRGIFYPLWWVEKIGAKGVGLAQYHDDHHPVDPNPPRVDVATPPATPQAAAPALQLNTQTIQPAVEQGSGLVAFFMCALLVAAVGFGYMMGRRSSYSSL